MGKSTINGNFHGNGVYNGILVNYNDWALFSLTIIIVSEGNHPKIALIQVSEIWQFTRYMILLGDPLWLKKPPWHHFVRGEVDAFLPGAYELPLPSCHKVAGRWKLLREAVEMYHGHGRLSWAKKA
jgi:hypothetical protein